LDDWIIRVVLKLLEDGLNGNIDNVGKAAKSRLYN